MEQQITMNRSPRTPTKTIQTMKLMSACSPRLSTPVANPFPPEPDIRAFTLIELLVVMGIIALVMSFAIPAMTGIMSGSQLTQATDLVVGQLKYASQTALSQNRPVDVRFYLYSDPNIPGSTKAIRAIQLWQTDASGLSRTAVNKVQHFPGTIIISPDTTLTTLPATGTSTSLPSKEVVPSLPQTAPNGPYIVYSFQYRPDGSTNLSSASGNTWCVTVVNENTPGAAGVPPKNFATIQIEPVTGAVRLYRP